MLLRTITLDYESGVGWPPFTAARFGWSLPLVAKRSIVPAIATADVALLLSRERAAPLAYVGGSLGTLTGADLLNLGNIRGLGAPIASIGGAGTFDGIFVTGVLAVVIASLTTRSDRENRPAAEPS